MAICKAGRKAWTEPSPHPPEETALLTPRPQASAQSGVLRDGGPGEETPAEGAQPGMHFPLGRVRLTRGTHKGLNALSCRGGGSGTVPDYWSVSFGVRAPFQLSLTVSRRSVSWGHYPEGP